MYPYMLRDRYTLVDMSVWGWARVVPFILGDKAWDRLPNVKRLLEEISARPAAQRAEALKTQHAFKADMDDEARRILTGYVNALSTAKGWQPYPT